MNWRSRAMRVFVGACTIDLGVVKLLRPACPAAACVALVALFALPSFAASFNAIVTTGDASPDGNGTLVTFTAPALNDAGQVAFMSQLTGTDSPPDDGQALYRASTGALTVIAHMGMTEVNGQPIASFVTNFPSINNLGTVSHEGEPAGAPGKYVAFQGVGGPLATYLGVGSASPSGNNSLVSHSVPVINNNGVSTYRAFYTGVNFEVGIYSRTSAGVTTLRLAQGVTAPRGGEIESLTQSLPTINETAQLALTASVFDGVFSRKSAIRLDGTTAVELARDGDMAEDAVTTIGNILSNAVPLNDVGQITFEATYSQPSVSLRPGIFRVGNEGAILLTPGLLPGAPAQAMNMRVTSINNAGTVAFTTEFTGGGGDPVSGVYLANPGGPTLVALEDTLTPEGNRYFRRFFTESVALNEDGQLAFLAELSTIANGANAGRGIYRYDPIAGLQQIIRTGQSFLGSTISSVNFVGDFYSALEPLGSLQAPDPTSSGLNNSNQLAFAFSLANGESGIAIWSEATAQLFGDFNNDGFVDAADYTVWRNNLGDPTDADIHNLGDGNPGVDAGDYAVWRRNYGKSNGGGGSIAASSPISTNAPEPAAAALAVLGGLLTAATRRRAGIAAL